VRALRPTINTKFHIDLSWWEKHNRDIRVYMLDHLCAECRESVGTLSEVKWIDMVDPDTAEVLKVDALWEAIRACCSVKPGYITADTPLLDSIFRVLLANGNRALSVQELYDRLNRRPPETILRVLTKGRVYLGIRPVQ
jgi:hypothetical protein